MTRTLAFFVLFLMLSGCEKVLFNDDQASTNPLVNFDYLWNEVDRKYSYFELKAIDWDEARVTYRNMLNEGSTEEELFEVLAQLLNVLRDDHTNLFSPFNVSRYNIALQHPKNFNARTLQEHYLPNGRITGAFFHDFLAEGEVGYVRYSSFSSNVSAGALNHVINRYADTRGMVVDLRENGGGSIINVTTLLERFTDVSLQAGFFVTRNGPNHNDFGAPQNFRVGVADGVRYTKPVVVLVDRGSYSATTMFAVGARAFQNITLMGDTTGGGGGLPNGGQLPNGWTYRFSVSQLIDLNGNNYAENGLPPDVVASFDWNDLTRDEVLDAAIDHLLND